MPHPLIDPSLSLTQSLAHHLQYNHYPPIDLRWLPICEEAIAIAVGAGEVCVVDEADNEGLYFADESVLNVQVGQGKTAQEVLDGLHLWDYVEHGVFTRGGGVDPEPKAGE